MENGFRLGQRGLFRILRPIFLMPRFGRPKIHISLEILISKEGYFNKTVKVEAVKIEDIDNCSNKIESLIQNQNFDALFAVNELYAVTAMKVVRKLGMHIPNDVQVIGFTDGVLSKHARPSLTTVSQHGQKIGEKAADLLIDRLERDELEEADYIEESDRNEHFKTVVIETELIERDSTK